jgi:acetyl esterase/lipase
VFRPTCAALLALVALVCTGSGAPANRRPALPPRLTPQSLEAAHAARLEWAKSRKVLPQLGIYRDFRAILHIHAQDAPHTPGTREQVLAAARETGVSVIMWTDHRGPLAASWHGMRDGVLFLPGSEDTNRLRFPGADGDLLFMSHLEETPAASSDGFAGMEVYNRHADFERKSDFRAYLDYALKHRAEWRTLVDRLKSYPLEFYAAGTGVLEEYVARYDKEIARHPFTAIAANDAHRGGIYNGVLFDPYEVAFRFVSTHILARELTEDQIRQSLRDGHAYVAHDWLCDPQGFSFAASNNVGVYDIGDQVPAMPNTRLTFRLPVAAHAKIVHNGAVVYESNASEGSFTPKEDGPYRFEAWLPVAGEERPWIFSNPLVLYKPAPAELALPPNTVADNVKVIRGIDYAAGDTLAKHKLDLYLPAGKTNFPVLFFVHGGAWRGGDRSQYTSLGNRFAKLGIGVAIPSYRLAPANPHPAQIEDVAAAFAWTAAHIGEYGGDARQLYAAGHSAGGHLVSLLALDAKYLAAHKLTPAAMRGVISSSGVFDVRSIEMFGGTTEARWDASPLKHVHSGAPPFLILYCQWDYSSLPAQARELDGELRRALVDSKAVFIPGESHISEMVHLWKDNDPTAREILNFVGPAAR